MSSWWNDGSITCTDPTSISAAKAARQGWMFICWNSFIIPTCQLKVDWALLFNTFTGPSGQLNQSNRSDLVADVDHGVLCLTTLSSSVHNIPGYFRIQSHFFHPTQIAFGKQNTFWRPQPEVCFSAWQVGLLPARSWLWPKLFPTRRQSSST